MEMGTKTTVILIVLMCAFLGSFGQILFKIASAKFSFNLREMITNIPLIIGILLYAASAFGFIWALKYGNLSVLYPVIATSYVWVTILSAFFFKEAITLNKIAGIGLIIAGVTLIVL